MVKLKVSVATPPVVEPGCRVPRPAGALLLPRTEDRGMAWQAGRQAGTALDWIGIPASDASLKSRQRCAVPMPPSPHGGIPTSDFPDTSFNAETKYTITEKNQL